MNQTAKYQRGDLVETQFDTGAFGYRVLYGKVTAAGEKQFAVLWESGLSNRMTYGKQSHLVKYAQDTAEAQRVMGAT